MKDEIVRQLELLNQNDKILDELYHSYAASVHLSETAFWILYIAWTQGTAARRRRSAIPGPIPGRPSTRL